MSEIRGCNIPDDLLYWPEKHTWCQRGDDGAVTVGVTDVAQNLAGVVISALPKPAGKSVKRGRSPSVGRSPPSTRCSPQTRASSTAIRTAKAGT